MTDRSLPHPKRADQRQQPLLRTMLGDVLRRVRTEQGRTLADVARAARVSMPYLSEVERGRKEASSEVLAAICQALHTDLSDVLGEVRSHLAERDTASARVVRLDAVRHRQVAARRQVPGSDDVLCLAA